MFNIPTSEDIKNYRKKAGLTQAELARKSNLSQSLIARIESNTVDPRLSTVRKIIDAIEETMRLKKTVKDILMLKSRDKNKLPALISLDLKAKALDAIALMKKYGVSQIPVLDQGRPVGCVLESDLLEKAVQRKDLSNLSVQDVMTNPLPVVSINSKIEDVNKFFTQGHPAVLVSENGSIIGILTKIDILSYTTT
ncbi:MAG: CBS domain-containing protein [Candidatus Odinarchaeum yellowstonii]|uniref:CBS domain-containing protein n=1 Tax=Odinarchaeota yellowstonii (strain LCB_4) TaxID=1841599 RepID=A0AAF0IDL0_ODILC|nr:MAG: CBS domain-containing protein [Candidatus Odinarchaeum yellowstonii]